MPTGLAVPIADGPLLTWVSKKQPTLFSRSSAEAEYKALALTTYELLWLSYLLTRSSGAISLSIYPAL